MTKENQTNEERRALLCSRIPDATYFAFAGKTDASEGLARLACYGPDDFDNPDVLYMTLADIGMEEADARLVAYG